MEAQSGGLHAGQKPRSTYANLQTAHIHGPYPQLTWSLISRNLQRVNSQFDNNPLC